MSNIFNQFNLSTEDISEYNNYLNNLSSENNEYKNILKQINSDSSTVLNNNMESYNNLESDDIDEMLKFIDQKTPELKLYSYNLLIDTIDRNYIYFPERFNFSVIFTPYGKSIKKIKKYLYENNQFDPFSSTPITPNLEGFCYNGKYYPPYKPPPTQIEKGKYIDPQPGPLIYNGSEPAYVEFDQIIKTSINIQINKNFKNIYSIEIKELIMPFQNLYINDPLPNITNIYPYQTNINSYPYVLLYIQELNAENYGSDENIDNSVVALSHTDHQYSISDKGTRNFIKLTPVNKSIIDISPVPLANFKQLNFSIRDPYGNKPLKGIDGIKIRNYTVINRIPERDTPICTGCNNEFTEIKEGGILNYGRDTNNMFNNYIIKLQLDTYFTQEEFKTGDLLIIKDFKANIYANWDYYYSGYDFINLTCNEISERCQKPKVIKDIKNLPYYQNELNAFNSFINKTSGHKILWTDNLSKPKFDAETITSYWEGDIDIYQRPIVEYPPKDIPLYPNTITHTNHAIKKGGKEIKVITIDGFETNTIGKIGNKENNQDSFVVDQIIGNTLIIKSPLKHNYVSGEKVVILPNTEAYLHNTIYILGPIDETYLENENILKCEDYFEKLIKQDRYGKIPKNITQKQSPYSRPDFLYPNAQILDDYPIMLMSCYWSIPLIPFEVKINDIHNKQSIKIIDYVNYPTILFQSFLAPKYNALISPQMLYIQFYYYSNTSQEFYNNPEELFLLSSGASGKGSKKFGVQNNTPLQSIDTNQPISCQNYDNFIQKINIKPFTIGVVIPVYIEPYSLTLPQKKQLYINSLISVSTELYKNCHDRVKDIRDDNSFVQLEFSSSGIGNSCPGLYTTKYDDNKYNNLIPQDIIQYDSFIEKQLFGFTLNANLQAILSMEIKCLLPDDKVLYKDIGMMI